jgi:hypothetical protein
MLFMVRQATMRKAALMMETQRVLGRLEIKESKN